MRGSNNSALNTSMRNAGASEQNPHQTKIGRLAQHPILTGLALAASIVLSIFVASPASASTAEPSPQARAALVSTERFSEVLATQAYRRLAVQAERAQDRGARGAEASIGYLPRVRALPDFLRTGLVRATAERAEGSRPGKPGVDADFLLGFRAGPVATQSCLDLRTGSVSAHRCGDGGPVGATSNLMRSYLSVYKTVVWFDRNAAVYGATVRESVLVDRIVNVEFDGAVSASYTDTDSDGLIDSGEVSLVHEATGECGLVALPEHDPAGESYDAQMLPCRK